MDELEPASSSVTFNYGLQVKRAAVAIFYFVELGIILLQASTFSVDCLGQKAVLAV